MSKKLKSMQLAISALFALFVPFLIWYLGSYYQELYASVAIFFCSWSMATYLLVDSGISAFPA